MKFIKLYFKEHIYYLSAIILSSVLAGIIFYLYNLKWEILCYPTIVCFAVWFLFVASDVYVSYKRHISIARLQTLNAELISTALPNIYSNDDADYQTLVSLLCSEQALTIEQMEKRYCDTVDYYTVWVHQIKTPIAAIKLKLQNEDSMLSRSVMSELNRIEQYVEMVLVYLRLGSDSTDYVFREYQLDDIIHAVIKRFSSDFIGRNLRLEYSPLNKSVITDEKWLTFVLEQIVSNALKYTVKGYIAIYIEEDSLCIKDTGIGISANDIPRVFENGYTGYNGRLEKKASGIGLYLCKEICEKLGHNLSIESEIDKGTCVKIDLRQYRPQM